MIKEQYKPNKNEGTYLPATTSTEHFKTLIDAKEYANALSESSKENVLIQNSNKKRKKNSSEISK
ncbi:hypothetical protein QTP88_020881 [Uroleucon formosanum]